MATYTPIKMWQNRILIADPDSGVVEPNVGTGAIFIPQTIEKQLSVSIVHAVNDSSKLHIGDKVTYVPSGCMKLKYKGRDFLIITENQILAVEQCDWDVPLPDLDHL